MKMTRNISIPSHIFISYAHADKVFVDQLLLDLQSENIPVWIDRVGIAPGTSNWDRSIREAILSSFALLFIASPNASESSVVQGELSLARSYGCPIYPVWARGDKWAECVPLEMVTAQYINCRGEVYRSGLPTIVEVLRREIDTRSPKHAPIGWQPIHPGYLSVYLPDRGIGHIGFKIDAYQSVQDFLNELYMAYLTEQVQPYSYGRDWILRSTVSLSKNRIVAPWSWFIEGKKNNFKPHLISDDDMHWARCSLETYGLVTGSKWEIDEPPDAIYGLATNNEHLAQDMLSPDPGSLSNNKEFEYLLGTVPRKLITLPNGSYKDHDGFLMVMLPDGIHLSDYKYTYIFSRRPILTGKVLVYGGPWPFDKARLFLRRVLGQEATYWRFDKRGKRIYEQ